VKTQFFIYLFIYFYVFKLQFFQNSIPNDSFFMIWFKITFLSKKLYGIKNS